MFTVYLITNKLNGKVYVGQTNQPLSRRWTLHKSRMRQNKGYTAHLYNAMRKYGLDAFEIKTIAMCETQEWTNYLETLYILIYDSTKPKIGYNMTTGGEHPTPTPEFREQQRQKSTGRKHTDDSRARTSESLKLAYAEGRHPGTRGRKAPQEERDKQSERMSGKGHPNFNHKICSEELVRLWNNRVLPSKIAEHFGISLDTVRRRVKSTGLEFINYRDPVEQSGANSPQYKRIDESLMKELFFQNVSIRQIGIRLGIDHHGVDKRIKALGLTRKEPK